MKSFTENELSSLTHNLDLWKSKEARMKLGEKQIEITEEDITENDNEFFKNFFAKYEYLKCQGFIHFQISEKIFRILENHYQKLSVEHHEVIDLLSRDDELENPVLLELDKQGVLLID